MKHVRHFPVSCLVAIRRTLTAPVCLALVAAGGFSAVAASAMAADAALSCPSGQISATRIDYEGKYHPGPTLAIFNLQQLAPRAGYTRRTVLVADGYYKQTSEGFIAAVKDRPPGKPIPIPGVNRYVQELPSRAVILETPEQRLVYDERGDPEELGTRRSRSKQFSVADEHAIVGALQNALAPSAGNVKVLGQANYAGIPCEVRQFLVPGDSVCIAKIHGRPITLAEDLQSPARTERSWMTAKTRAEVCVSLKEFEPPATVRFE